MYSDIESQQVNVLYIYSVTSDRMKGFHNIIFKELNTLDEISIKLTDQLRREIDFLDSISVSCTLNLNWRI